MRQDEDIPYASRDDSNGVSYTSVKDGVLYPCVQGDDPIDKYVISAVSGNEFWRVLVFRNKLLYASSHIFEKPSHAIAAGWGWSECHHQLKGGS